MAGNGPKNKPILIYDCSGQPRHRQNWRIFYQESDAVVFVIDATNKFKLKNVKLLIQDLANDPYIKQKKMPILFLAHKQDLVQTNSEQTGMEVDIQKVIQPDVTILKQKIKGIPVSQVIKSSAFGNEFKDGFQMGVKWIYTMLCKQNKI